MDPDAFLDDLRVKPMLLTELADRFDAANPWSWLTERPSRVLFLGMGSSQYAASVAAARLRAKGIWACAELASTDLVPEPDHGSLVVAVSASGTSRETVAALAPFRDRCPTVLLTNDGEAARSAGADHVVELRAGPERGGVACRSFQHTLAVLLALEEHLLGQRGPTACTVRAAAEASADLLDRSAEWLPEVRRLGIGPHGTHIVAPARRLSSAQQSALMLREGPRLPAVGCETGDWSHVDVYLTKTTDYRMLLLPGSRWEPELLRWTAKRGSTVVAVGGDIPEATLSLRYRHDGVDDVRLLAEVLVAELLAADLWLRPDA